jgi:phosphopantothenoylcysteine decarboxylase/phosphopantothenate--cysteine ligase
MGYALASAAARRDWQVDLVSGPVALTVPTGVTRHSVISAVEMLAACTPLFSTCDLFIAVAAVADYRPKERFAQKQKKHGEVLALELVPTVDVLRTLAATKRPGQVVVGFAAETHDVEAYARRKLAEKKLDWIVANDVSGTAVGMNADDNTVTVIGGKGICRTFGPAPKSEVAEFILDLIAPVTESPSPLA